MIPPGPEIFPAALQPVWRHEFLTLPTRSKNRSLDDATLRIALDVFREMAATLADKLSDIGADSSLVSLIKRLMGRVALDRLNLRSVFLLGHDFEYLKMYDSYVVNLDGWLSSNFVALQLFCGRILNQFVEWTEFSQTASAVKLTALQIDQIPLRVNSFSQKLKAQHANVIDPIIIEFLTVGEVPANPVTGHARLPRLVAYDLFASMLNVKTCLSQRPALAR